MLASATHDTKRGEDARARLNVLSEMPTLWRRISAEWRKLNARRRTAVDREWAPDPNDEYLFYQTLLASWPAEAVEGPLPSEAPAREHRKVPGVGKALAEIIDRCDAMSPEDLMRLHGTFRDPGPMPPSWSDASDPFAIFNDHDPETGEVMISGTTVRKGSLVRLNPRRRADAQDVFYADQLARVTAIHRDLDDETHVAVVLVDDPAADLHDWYGRYLYFSPDEVVPLGRFTQ